MNEKEQLMKKLQEIDFALTDLSLYLDTHPDCNEALADHKKLRAEREKTARDYEQQFGPLTAGGTANTDFWDWTATPWPWENC